MSKEKQNEEIILAVKNAVADYAAIDRDTDLIILDGNDLDHLAEQVAETLYNAGAVLSPCKVGDKVAVRALCECVLTTPCNEECRYICPFEDDCDCEECSSLNERIFETTVSSIFNNGQGWYVEFKHLIPFAKFTDIGTSFFVGENAYKQAVAYEKALAERRGDETETRQKLVL